MVEQRWHIVALLLPPNWKHIEHWPVALLPDSSAIAGSDRSAGGSDQWVCLGTQRPSSAQPTRMAESCQLWWFSLWNCALNRLLF